MFVLLVALGSDYNIFVTSRIREESRDRPIRDGIRIAAARTGTVVTSAGIILAGTFAALMTAPLELLFQVGAAVAMGVLIDTFVVRSLLVPALTAVFGDWSLVAVARPRPADGAADGAEGVCRREPRPDRRRTDRRLAGRGTPRHRRDRRPSPCERQAAIPRALAPTRTVGWLTTPRPSLLDCSDPPRAGARRERYGAPCWLTERIGIAATSPS